MDFFIELLKVIIISLAIIIPIRYFLIQPFYVKGASMEPNFFDHEYLVIDEISYRFKEPQRGEIIVFRYPKDPQQFFIKRIIGLPGETVHISNEEVYVDGELLDESDYLADSVVTGGDVTVTLGVNEYFVMGDNREYSLDSRKFGAVDGDLTIGRTWIRGWPFSKIKVFDVPEYNL